MTAVSEGLASLDLLAKSIGACFEVVSSFCDRESVRIRLIKIRTTSKDGIGECGSYKAPLKCYPDLAKAS